MLKLLKILLISNLVTLASCKHPTPPTWNGKLYAGDSLQGAIVRAQSNETIYCDTPLFDDYVCLSYSDYKDFIRIYVDGCAMWKDEAKEYINKLNSCGLINKKNVNKINKCLIERDSK